MTYIRWEGKPTFLAAGYSTIKFTYDARGNVGRQRYFGLEGEPVVHMKEGYHGWEAEYNERGNRIALTYIGLDGKPRP